MGTTERGMIDAASTAMTSVHPHPARLLLAHARPARLDPEDILYEDSSEHVIDKPDEGVTGAGGTQRYVFKANKDGAVTVTFASARRWEDVAPAQTAIYTFTVKDGLITQDSVTTPGDIAGTDDLSSTNVD